MELKTDYIYHFMCKRNLHLFSLLYPDMNLIIIIYRCYATNWQTGSTLHPVLCPTRQTQRYANCIVLTS